MTPRTEKKVARIIKEMKQEREQTFIMVIIISVLYNVRPIGSILMEIMLSIILVE
jgi:hypothetical protein